MRTAVLTRYAWTDDGTFGDLVLDTGLALKSIELPWRDDLPDKSCIPPGVYQFEWLWSRAHGCNLYHLINIPNRNAVEIHAANVAGDVDKDLFSQLLGCIAPGLGTAVFEPGSIPGLLKPQQGITASKDALAQFEAAFRDSNGNQLAGTLTIR